MPFAQSQFNLVHTSVALRKMETKQLEQIIQKASQFLKPEIVFSLIDLHKPNNSLY